MRPPSWRSATTRAAIAAAVFLVVLILFQQPPVSAIFIAIVMFGFYIPLGYYTDVFLYKRRVRKEQAAQAAAAQAKAEKKAAQTQGKDPAEQQAAGE